MLTKVKTELMVLDTDEHLLEHLKKYEAAQRWKQENAHKYPDDCEAFFAYLPDSAREKLLAERRSDIVVSPNPITVAMDEHGWLSPEPVRFWR